MPAIAARYQGGREDSITKNHVRSLLQLRQALLSRLDTLALTPQYILLKVPKTFHKPVFPEGQHDAAGESLTETLWQRTLPISTFLLPPVLATCTFLLGCPLQDRGHLRAHHHADAHQEHPKFGQGGGPRA